MATNRTFGNMNKEMSVSKMPMSDEDMAVKSKWAKPKGKMPLKKSKWQDLKLGAKKC